MASLLRAGKLFARRQNGLAVLRSGEVNGYAKSTIGKRIVNAAFSTARIPSTEALNEVNVRGFHTSTPVGINAPMSQVIIEAAPTAPVGGAIVIDAVDLHGQRSEAWYTGQPPVYGRCAGVERDGRIYSLPQLTFKNGVTTKQALQDYFDNTWTITEALLGCLQGEEAFTAPPYHDLRHPMIFYYGHPAALYINKLRVAGLLKEPINPYFEVIFETGVDEMSWDDLSKNKMPWPSVAEVRHYRTQVYQRVTEVIQGLTEAQLSSVTMDSPLWALVLGFEHERIHIETSSVLITELPLKYVQLSRALPAYHSSVPKASTDKPVAGVHYPQNSMISVGAQTVTLGKPREYPSFGWDNEYGARQYQLNDFRASAFKVSNGEFFEFVSEGGYSKRELWSDVGWEWRAYRNVKHPCFWVRRGPQGAHQYDLRILADVVPMAWDWPACVNFHEAEAFTRWRMSKDPAKHYRILGELEHHAMRDGEAYGGRGVEAAYEGDFVAHSGGSSLLEKGINANLSCSSMSPVNALPPSEQGFYDVFGNAWEWTVDKFCALPGFEVHPYYEDFSTPCFDGLHYVIQGGSFISTGHEASVFARYHFRPHFYQHAGFRLVEQPKEQLVTSDTDAPGPFVGSYPFRRSREALMRLASGPSTGHREASRDSLLSMHFGLNPASGAPFKRFEELILQHTRAAQLPLNTVNALEVGSGPGGLTFALARSFDSVIGVDHHQESVEMARQLYEGKALEFAMEGEGELFTTYLADLAAHPTPLAARRVEFRQADPMCLPAEMSGFSVVVLNDVVDKISSPNSLLGRLGGVRGLVKKDGLLFVISAYEWDANTTPRSLWLGGYVDKATGKKVSSEDTLVEKLSEDFRLVHRETVPVNWSESLSRVAGRLYNTSVFQRK